MRKACTRHPPIALEGVRHKKAYFISLSFDPERDTQPVLRDYAHKFNADLTNWSFVTGPESEVKRVCKAFGVGFEKRPDGTFEHTALTVLIDQTGRVRDFYGGAEYDPNKAVQDIKALLAAPGS